MVRDVFDISGRVIAITGGLGQLGKQFSSELVRRKAKVVALDVTAPARTRLSNPWALHCDITSERSLRECLQKIRDRWGVPHGLINNAALDAPPNAPPADVAAFETYSAETWRRVIDVNLTGSFLACQVIGSAMAKERRGSIINISSIYGILSPDQRIYEYRERDGAPFKKPIAYSASKAGILNLSRYLATYWAKQGVRVNTLTFGGVENRQDPRFIEGYRARVPLDRMAAAHEYNGAVVFLLSEAASYMTGSNVVLDGGWSAW